VNSGQRFNGGLDGGAPYSVRTDSRLVGSLVVHLGCRVVQLLNPFETQTATQVAETFGSVLFFA